MFGWFGKKAPPRRIVAPDAVFMYRRVADEALARTAQASDLPVIVVSFFPASLSRVRTVLNEKGLDALPLDAGGWPVYEDVDDAIWLLSAGRITQSVGFDNWLSKSGRECLFLFVEHYPLIGMEDAVLDVLEKVALSKMQRAIFFVGMDEPLMQVFGTQKVIGMMQSLGMDENERISHPMVDKAILNARKRIDSKVPKPHPTDSDVEWFERNRFDGK